MSSQARAGIAGSITRWWWLPNAAVVWVAMSPVAAVGQPGGGVFSEAQATAGRAVYLEACAECHGQALQGGAHGPSLEGVGFLSAWGARTTRDLVEFIREEMPPGLGGSLLRESQLLFRTTQGGSETFRIETRHGHRGVG